MVIYISDLEVLHGHRDYNQVVLDVNRSLKRFPPGNLSDMKKIASEMSSAEVVCCKLLPNITDELSIEANSVDPEQTATIGADSVDPEQTAPIGAV